MDTLANTTTVGTTRPITLPLYNLRCAADAQTVDRFLSQEPGVGKVYANPATEKVYIEYDATLTNPDRLRGVLREAGFGQKPLHMTCGRCQ